MPHIEHGECQYSCQIGFKDPRQGKYACCRLFTRLTVQYIMFTMVYNTAVLEYPLHFTLVTWCLQCSQGVYNAHNSLQSSQGVYNLQ